MRLGDLDQLQEKVQRKKYQLGGAREREGFNDAIMRVKSMIHSAPTIDPGPCSRRLPLHGMPGL